MLYPTTPPSTANTRPTNTANNPLPNIISAPPRDFHDWSIVVSLPADCGGTCTADGRCGGDSDEPLWPLSCLDLLSVPPDEFRYPVKLLFDHAGQVGAEEDVVHFQQRIV